MGLKLNFTKLSYDGKWYDFDKDEQVEKPEGDNVFLKIRPYPAKLSNISIRDGAVVITGDEQFKVFMYCLEAWKNIQNAEGKELQCNDENKKKVFDFRIAEIPNFVTLKAANVEETKRASEKN